MRIHVGRTQLQCTLQERARLVGPRGREQVTRIVSVTVGRRRRESQRLLEVLLSQRALLCRIFGNGKVDQENRILRRELLRAMKIIERAGVIPFGHQRVAIVHQSASVLRAFDRNIVPKRFFGFPHAVALTSGVAARCKQERQPRKSPLLSRPTIASSPALHQ